MVIVSLIRCGFRDDGLDLSAATLPWREFFSPSTMRWVFGSHNVVFTNVLQSAFFTSGKTVPLVRGWGVYQVRISDLDWKKTPDSYVECDTFEKELY